MYLWKWRWWWCLASVKPTPSWCYLQDSCPFHLVCKLHLQMGITRQLLHASNYCFINVYQPYIGTYYGTHRGGWNVCLLTWHIYNWMMVYLTMKIATKI
jgi:hypothetical protein